MTDNQTCDQDQQITSIADAVVKLKELRESNKNLNEPDIEFLVASVTGNCLFHWGFKTDKFTLGKRLDLQLRQRDIAEKNIETELKNLRESLNQFLRRGSLGTFTRIPAIENDKIFALENHSGLTSAWNLSSIRQKLECKTRLLSAVCLLNNNYDSPRTISNGNSGSVSPKSRRASLPVGPLAHSSNNVNAPFSNVRAHASINEKHAFNIERKESNAKLSRESHLTRTESEDSTNSKPEADCPFQEPSEKMSEDSSSLKDMN
ncbi:hypothetical protein HNY73_017825 [Argiope bruennichi]|uniref:Uncharacterized protein n=1 Tax=Argiope bruennichi TaxID=94029 RepID=A0A8T0EEZ6_ARGBR|nr:hypothetical protein HNY73_017825 [Argiope bruennichi]